MFRGDIPGELTEEQLTQFHEAYTQLFNVYENVSLDYREMSSVKRFLLAYSSMTKAKNARDYSGDSPQSVAFAILFSSGFDFNYIDSPTYRGKVANLISVSDEQVCHGIYHILTNSRSEIVNRTRTGLSRYRSNDPYDYLQNRVLPILKIISSDFILDKDILEPTYRQFNTLFDVPSDEDPLRDLIDNYQDYRNGGALSTRYSRRVNEFISSENLYLALDVRYAALFEIDTPVCRIKDPAIRAVQVVRETELSGSTSPLGMSLYNEKVVNIYANSIDRQVERIVNVLAGEEIDSARLAQMNVWLNYLEVPMETHFAPEHFYRDLLTYEFEAFDSLEIVEKMHYKVALHEAKHAWDTQFDEERENRRQGFDAEVSAHLTDAYYSDIPHYALFAFLQRISRYIRHRDLQGRILTLTDDVWIILHQKMTAEIDDEQFRLAIAEIYEDYRDRDGLPLKDMKLFEDDVALSLQEFDWGQREL